MCHNNKRLTVITPPEEVSRERERKRTFCFSFFGRDKLVGELVFILLSCLGKSAHARAGTIHARRGLIHLTWFPPFFVSFFYYYYSLILCSFSIALAVVV